jgi:hypothetical protein
MHDNPILGEIVDVFYNNTLKWAEDVGLDKLKKKEIPASPNEVVWRDYFRDHKFNSLEDTRNMADLIGILTGITVNKFIKTSRANSSVEYYPGFICIIPIDNENSHDYRIGVPVISIQAGTVFYKHHGATGNNMSKMLKCVGLPTRDQVKFTLIKCFYSNPGLADRIVKSM